GGWRKEGTRMRRMIVLAGIPFIAAFLGGLLAFSVVVPTMVDAQEARIRAESVTISGAGSDRLRMATKWDGQASDFSLLAPDGTSRLIIGAGGIGSADPESAGININAANGSQVVRLGTGRGPAGTLPLTTSLVLFDQ